MQISRIMPKAVPYILAGAAMIGVSTTSLAKTNDSFEKEKKELTVTEPTKEDAKKEKDIPWGEIIPVGCLVAFLGTILLGEHIDRKIDEKEAKKQQQANVDRK